MCGRKQRDRADTAIEMGVQPDYGFIKYGQRDQA